MMQIIRDELVLEYPKLFGRGLEDQITYFNGRSGEWYRYEDDSEALKNFFSKKPLSAPVFQPEYHSRFESQLREFRAAISISPRAIKDDAAHVQLLTRISHEMYPTYNLSNFIPGAWRDAIADRHGRQAQKVFDRFFRWRGMSEGVLKQASDFVRSWLGLRARACGYPAEYIAPLSVRELLAFCKTKKLNAASAQKRLKGYVYFAGRITPCTDFSAFLRKKRLVIDTVDTEQNEFSGTVACAGGLIKGTVATIFNSSEVNRFPKGCILVTPMTQPEYVPAMKKAKAIITDEGGLTCHAAIVSRELKIPCIIGTKIATRLLRDGDKVEVDAKNGVVTIVERHS